jgi:hypothetical protein
VSAFGSILNSIPYSNPCRVCKNNLLCYFPFPIKRVIHLITFIFVKVSLPTGEYTVSFSFVLTRNGKFSKDLSSVGTKVAVPVPATVHLNVFSKLKISVNKIFYFFSFFTRGLG